MNVNKPEGLHSKSVVAAVGTLVGAALLAVAGIVLRQNALVLFGIGALGFSMGAGFWFFPQRLIEPRAFLSSLTPWWNNEAGYRIKTRMIAVAVSLVGSVFVIAGFLELARGD